MENKLVIKGADITADIPAVRITRDDITKHFCPLATQQEVAMALAIVKSLNLNPFLREVHFIKYDQKSKMAIVVGYETYLKRAERSGKLNGWTAGINTAENFAWVKIWRKDWKEPFEWTVNLNEFNKKQSTWNQIPSFMGRKVAIAQGFRLCFPDELGGLPYTEEEHQVYDIEAEPTMKPQVQMPRAIPDKTALQSEADNEPSTPLLSNEKIEPDEDLKAKPTLGKANANLLSLENLAKEVFKSKADFINWLGSAFGVEKITELTDEQIKEAKAKIVELKKMASK